MLLLTVRRLANIFQYVYSMRSRNRVDGQPSFASDGLEQEFFFLIVKDLGITPLWIEKCLRDETGIKGRIKAGWCYSREENPAIQSEK